MEQLAVRHRYPGGDSGFPLRSHCYVDTFEPEEEIDIQAVRQEIDGIEAALAKTCKQMAVYLKELGYGS